MALLYVRGGQSAPSYLLKEKKHAAAVKVYKQEFELVCSSFPRP